jgi:hypothetical protein
MTLIFTIICNASMDWFGYWHMNGFWLTVSTLGLWYCAMHPRLQKAQARVGSWQTCRAQPCALAQPRSVRETARCSGRDPNALRSCASSHPETLLRYA